MYYVLLRAVGRVIHCTPSVRPSVAHKLVTQRMDTILTLLRVKNFNYTRSKSEKKHKTDMALRLIAFGDTYGTIVAKGLKKGPRIV